MEDMYERAEFARDLGSTIIMIDLVIIQPFNQWHIQEIMI